MNQIVEHRLQRLPFAREYGKARLVEPARSGYLFLAAEVDAHPPFLWASRNKRHLIEDCASWCARVARDPGVLEAAAFQAILIPPFGDTTFLRLRRNEFHRARFDLALLIETDSVERAEGLRRTSRCGNTRQAGSSRRRGSTTPPCSCRRGPTCRSTRCSITAAGTASATS